MIHAHLLTVLMTAGTVNLYVTDGHGKPLPNQEVWLSPTTSTKDVRPFGDFWMRISGVSGTTDAGGKVSIGGVNAGVPMMVVTRFGPRFNAYVRKNSIDHGSMDIMKFDGAVYAGRPAHIVLATDRQLAGRVTDYETRKPLAGLRVILSDTMYGHMSGYPLTALDEVKTDSSGRYVFRNLPNCTYVVKLETTKPAAVEAETTSERASYITGPEGWAVAGSDGAGVLLKQVRSVCDFKISKPATLSAIVRRGGEFSKGWYIMFEPLSPVGFEGGGVLGWNSAGIDSNVIESSLIHGKYKVTFMRQSDMRRFEVAIVRLRSGEHRRLEFDLSKVIRRKGN